MNNDHAQMARQIIAACTYARTAHETWLARRGLTLEQAKALPLASRIALQDDYCREFAH